MNPEDIPGWCDFDDIYQIAVDKFDEATFVEIGCWFGRSAASMASRIKKSGKKIKFYCIDTFKGSENEKEMKEIVDLNGGSLSYIFAKNLYECKVHDVINIIQEKSEIACRIFEDSSLDFIFIDAEHSYDGVKKDISMWLPKLKPGGIIAGHDYSSSWPGVCRAVNEMIKEFKIIGSSWISQ